jgi:hypothetical protein
MFVVESTAHRNLQRPAFTPVSSIIWLHLANQIAPVTHQDQAAGLESYRPKLWQQSLPKKNIGAAWCPRCIRTDKVVRLAGPTPSGSPRKAKPQGQTRLFFISLYGHNAISISLSSHFCPNTRMDIALSAI